MNVRKLHGGYRRPGGVVYKFLAVGDELVVGDFFQHKMLAKAAFGTEEVILTAAGDVVLQSGTMDIDWCSGGYIFLTPEDRRPEIQAILHTVFFGNSHHGVSG